MADRLAVDASPLPLGVRPGLAPEPPPLRLLSWSNHRPTVRETLRCPARPTIHPPVRQWLMSANEDTSMRLRCTVGSVSTRKRLAIVRGIPARRSPTPAVFGDIATADRTPYLQRRVAPHPCTSATEPNRETVLLRGSELCCAACFHPAPDKVAGERTSAVGGHRVHTVTVGECVHSTSSMSPHISTPVLPREKIDRIHFDCWLDLGCNQSTPPRSIDP